MNEIEDFLLRSINIMMQMRGTREAEIYAKQTIKIYIGQRSPVNFDISIDEKRELIAIGEKAVHEFLKRPIRPLRRRYSVS